MEGGKETAEEKEEEEEEEEKPLPIMHWEDLSQRIAELEKQEQERRERSKRLAGRSEEEEEDEYVQRRRVVSSRFHNHRNLQLCFINNSDSEEEEEEEGASKQVPLATKHDGCHAAGLKQEVAAALRARRDQLLAEQKQTESPAGGSSGARRKHLEPRELQEASVQQLGSIRAALQREVHALSSELVAQLLVRDQLRTKQDAMLLDVQDLT